MTGLPCVCVPYWRLQEVRSDQSLDRTRQKGAATAIKDRAAAGAVVGFAVKAAIALTGAAPLVVTIAPVLMPVGMTLYAYTAVKRISSALDDGLPLNRVGTYFCSPRCQVLHAKIGELALENDFLESALTKAGLPGARR